ncbi:hypothetical protein GBL97_13765 [Yersinia pseudotuberculosis]|nr:hypothetical protein EGX52_06010 [Yersinia pseudotuberculosis]MBO1566723.1 hypothetical protein [Yersinia pseudotuberculosis]MBO1590087.1 hypothetical protein [Yersinia pseudotuberculosis]MBO1603582.1 hypothetical protein [Yersinia pseudotuberculosis]PEI14240.1 hypothetical protein CRM78_14025 [Yersinia pseudotuberculosis]
MTNRSGTDLNAACSGLEEARPMDGPSNERSQRSCSLKYDGDKCSTHPVNMQRLKHTVFLND